MKFYEYITKINEGVTPNLPKDLSFSYWLVENASAEEQSAYAEIRANLMKTERGTIVEKAQLIMDLVKMKLFTHFPMWRPFWTSREPAPLFGAGSVDHQGVGTMMTTGSRIFYCPAFVLEQYEKGKIDFKKDFKDGVIPKANDAIKKGLRHPMDYVLFTVLHEIMHCSLKHFMRMPQMEESEFFKFKDLADLWNIAVDYEVNHYLLSDPKANLYVIPKGLVRADEGPFMASTPEEKKLFSEGFAEEIYDRLLSNMLDKKQKKKEEEDKKKGGEKKEEPEEEKSDKGTPKDLGGEDLGGDSGDGSDDGGDDDPEDNSFKVGDIIHDFDKGKYGKITNISGDVLEWDEISEEEALGQ